MPKDKPNERQESNCSKQYVYANTLWIYGKSKLGLGNGKDWKKGTSQQGQPVACTRYKESILHVVHFPTKGALRPHADRGKMQKLREPKV